MENIIFGTYHLRGELLKPSLKLAQEFSINRYDTAILYGNERQIYESVPNSIITTKIYTANNKNQVYRDLKRIRKRYGGKLPSCILLHRPMPIECWVALTSVKSEGVTIGVSNYSIDMLEHLINYCNENSIQTPEINQIEVHPFVNCIPLIDYCKSKNIKVQGHTILTQGKFFSNPTITKIANNHNKTPAQVLMRWAIHLGIEVCISSKSKQHINELLEQFDLSDSEIDILNNIHKDISYRFYKNYNKLPSCVASLNVLEKERYIDDVVNKLLIDRESKYPSSICESLPLAGEAYRTIGVEIANKIFPELKQEARLVSYRQLVKKLRTQRTSQHQTEKMLKKGLTCTIPRNSLGVNYTPSITEPKPMPVDITDPNEFSSLLSWMEKAQQPPESETIFVRGALFPDGRMDLCKQVVGPPSIISLCETVKKSGAVKHFLLGNNVAFQDSFKEGADAIADLMRNNNLIETWYLAGNCIDSDIVTIISEALKDNKKTNALWLKRNPVGPLGAISLNKMLRVNTNLTILDLHNCALFNQGIINLLSHPEEIKALKHLYVDANGIEEEGADAISKWCKSQNVVSLYVSINRLGNNGVRKIVSSLHGSNSLKRLCLASTGFNDDVMDDIVSMALSCPKLISLNLGCYKSTVDMGEKPGNPFTDKSAPLLAKLLKESKSLKYLSTSGCSMSHQALLNLPHLDHISMDLGAGPWHHISSHNIRFIKHPSRVRHIDSIYRNKM